MSRGRHSFKLNDVKRAVRAAVACGLDVARFEIGPDGKITVITDGKMAVETDDPWDKALS